MLYARVIAKNCCFRSGKAQTRITRNFGVCNTHLNNERKTLKFAENTWHSMNHFVCLCTELLSYFERVAAPWEKNHVLIVRANIKHYPRWHSFDFGSRRQTQQTSNILNFQTSHSLIAKKIDFRGMEQVFHTIPATNSCCLSLFPEMADSDDDMPPLEYVGNVPPVTTSTPDNGDDDMPPLEYVGADASLGISLREGDRVILKGLSKTVLNGQTGTLQSFQKASKGRLPVKLDKSGSMLAVKPENIEKLAMAKSAGIPNHGVAVAKARNVDRNATDGGLDEEDELPPLEPAGCGEDDELPPLEYVGAVGPVANSEQHAGLNEAIAADGDDADDMPNLEYFGASGPSQSNCNGPSAEARATGGGASLDHANVESSSSSTFRQGDQVLIKGTAKPELDGQQGTIESIKDSNYQVKLEKTGKLLQLAPTNLHKIWLRGSGAGAMPPLQFVGQAHTWTSIHKLLASHNAQYTQMTGHLIMEANGCSPMPLAQWWKFFLPCM